MELVVDVVCSELLDPLRVALLERQLRAAFRSRQKASLKGRTRLERRLSELHEEKLAKLDGLRHGIDPALISGAIDRLSENESRVRDELSRMSREPDEQSLLTSVSRLRQAGPELSAALLSGPEELRRRILSQGGPEYRGHPWSCPIQTCLSGSRLPMIYPRREGPRSASQIDRARGGARGRALSI
jgi:hypothetical protein